MDGLTYLVYGLPGAALLIWQFRRRRRLEQQSRAVLEQTGAAEPASLHPVIDPARCIGCGSCVKACPEQEHHNVLGILDGRAHLVSPGDCIGHGACRQVCPVDAITLVFGSERRGVDIPLITPKFESTVPGMFIAGELGGMGLIRNALEQGRQAVEAIAQRGAARGERLDLVIVGAGPAGFAGALTAKSKNLRCVTLEQESLGGAVFQYPRGKLVMTAPANLPLLGKVNFRQTSKEALLEFWQAAERKTGVKINYRERVEDIVARRRRLPRQDQSRQLCHAQRAPGHRPAWHSAQARRAGRGSAEGRLSADRSAAVRRPAGARRWRRRQRAGGGREHRGVRRHGRALVPWRRIRSRQGRQSRPRASASLRRASCGSS